MRLLYLTHQFLPRHVGGTEVFLLGLVRRMGAAGHRVRVVAAREAESPAPEHQGPRRTEHDGLPVLEIHGSLGASPDPMRDEFDNPRVAELLGRELDEDPPDLVHAVHGMKLTGAALRAVTGRGIPLVVTLTDFWFVCPRHTLLTWDGRPCGGPSHPLGCLRCVRDLHGFCDSPNLAWPDPILFPAIHAWLATGSRPSFFTRDLEALLARPASLRRDLLAARRILALTGFQREVFVANGFPPGRLEVIPHGLELDGLEVPRPPRSGPLRVGFVGSLNRFKGPQVLVEALARIPEARVELGLHGPIDPANPFHRELSAAAARDPRIRLPGGFAPEELGKILARLDVLALPALWYENEPLAVKAALHLGIPVLIGDRGSLPGMLASPGLGRALPPEDPAAWAGVLAGWAIDPPPVGVHRQPAKSMDRNAAEMEAIYVQETS